MEVILKQDVEDLGDKHDLVKVKPGYARNFLIPRGYAMPASEGNKKAREETLRQREHKEAKAREEAQKALETLQKTPVKISAKVGDQGKIFGSVNTIQLANAIKEKGFEVNRKDIKIKAEHEPIKQTGTYEADIKLHKDVQDSIKFEVVGEGE
ncbi:MAG: 50S ribosomal protein L9 [Flavobacteriales bacterium]